MLVRTLLIISHYACFTTARRKNIQNDNDYNFPEVYFSRKNSRFDYKDNLTPEEKLSYPGLMSNPNDFINPHINSATEYPPPSYSNDVGSTLPFGIAHPPANDVLQNGNRGTVSTVVNGLSGIGVTTAVILALIILFCALTQSNSALPGIILGAAGTHRPMYINYINNIHLAKTVGHNPHLPVLNHDLKPHAHFPYRPPMFPKRNPIPTDPPEQIRRKSRRIK